MKFVIREKNVNIIKVEDINENDTQIIVCEDQYKNFYQISVGYSYSYYRLTPIGLLTNDHIINKSGKNLHDLCNTLLDHNFKLFIFDNTKEMLEYLTEKCKGDNHED